MEIAAALAVTIAEESRPAGDPIWGQSDAGDLPSEVAAVDAALQQWSPAAHEKDPLVALTSPGTSTADSEATDELLAADDLDGLSAPLRDVAILEM